MIVMYKLQDNQLLTVAGHFTKEEIYTLKNEGYRFDNPRVNRNGILIAN